MISGILNIKKEPGFTSHDVVAKLRGIVHQKKIGHTGTLDPDATGVLPVCLGKATKLCDLIGNWDKTYEAVLLLGKETDTEDTSGEVIREAPVEKTEEEIREAILSYVGDYPQIPPMYSAKKVQGKKLYELARKGIVIERKPCLVHISSIIIKKMELPLVTLEVTCSKGTYIRSLCRDIGKDIGCGGCMAKLVRTRVASFHIDNHCFTLSEIEQMRDEGTLWQHIIPVDTVFCHFPALTVKEEGEKKLYNGNPLSMDLCEKQMAANDIKETGEQHVKEQNLTKESKMYRVYDKEKHFIGIYQLEENHILKPHKLFL